jgi:hypothetical protein
MTEPSFRYFSQNAALDQNKTNARGYFFALIAFISIATFAMIFFYANLIPLHEDEAGYWYNFTHKTLANRNLPNAQIPNHTLTIYGAKLSLKLFGHNGIGYRFPVILFSLLSAGAMYVLALRFLKSIFYASLATVLLLLNPWFLHYAHELRGYPSYLFFVLISFILLDRIVTKGESYGLWALMLGVFVGIYYSSMGSIVFIFNFMATLWVLKITQYFFPGNERLLHFKAISLKLFFVFSLMAVAMMSFIVFYVDLRLILQNQYYQTIHGSWDWTWVVKLMADIFSTFLGYRYLDDPRAILYNYPQPIWIFSLVCFFYGLKVALDRKQIPALLFIVLYLLTILFNLANQHYIQTRAVCYLLPFIILFQAMGLTQLIKSCIKLTRINNFEEQKALYAVTSGILFFYFSIHTLGKYQNLEGQSENPYEQVRSFLKNETASTALIISSLSDTIGGFYLGEIIRDHTASIYKNEYIDSIIYLTQTPSKKSITLKNFFSKPEETLRLSKFSKIAHFENRGVRGDQIYVYKSSLKSNQQSKIFGYNVMKRTGFFGGDSMPCQKKIEDQGIRLICKMNLGCTDTTINITDLQISKDHYQLLIFHHINDHGTQSISSIVINRPKIVSGKIIMGNEFFEDTYSINPLVDELDDADKTRENIDSLTPSLKQLEFNQNLMMCMSGYLFNNNALIKDVKLFNFQFSS